MQKVWLYLVVSSDQQAETLPEQRRWGYDAAARLGAEVEAVFEGIASGRDGARAIFRDLIERLESTPKKHRPVRILMTRIDRVGRLPLDSIAALNEIRRLGATIHTRTDGDVPLDRVRDQIAPVLQSLMAGFENEVRSDKGRAAFARRRSEGKLIPAKPPYGIMRDAAGRAVIDPVCGPYVQEAFRRWNARESPVDIVRWLRDEAPPRQGRKEPITIHWSLSHLYKLIHKVESYRGVLIDEETWDRAQRRKKPESRPGNREHVYPYSGLTCHCGERLHPRTNGLSTLGKVSGAYKRYPLKTVRRWYVCQSLKHPDGPKFRSFREDRIDAAWASLLTHLALSPGPWIQPKPKRGFDGRVAALERRLAVLETKRARIHHAFEEGIYDVATMQQRLGVAAAEEREIREQLARAQEERSLHEERLLAQERIVDLIRNAAAFYEQATREERAVFNRRLMAAFGRPVISDEYAIAFPSLSQA